MGIKGLLVELRPITNRIHISELKGKRVAVDASCWLHRSGFTCAMQLALNKPSKAWLSWCLSATDVLLQGGITPLFVFDGIALQQKAEENRRRRDQRDSARQRGLHLMQIGNKREATNVFQQAITITPEMQRCFILALRNRSVEYIVAPYEADAQLGYLFQSGDVSAVISEDSDLILFGVRRLISKFAKDGFGELTDMALLDSSEAKLSSFTNALRSLTHEQFLVVCIMSGCDYVDGLPGVGLKTAVKYALQHNTPERILRAYCKKHPLPPDYHTNFKRALLTFQHQRVYDRSSESLCHLSGVEHLDDDGDFLGSALPKEIAKNLVTGALNTKTMAVLPFGNPHDIGDENEPTSENPVSKILKKQTGLPAFSSHVGIRKHNQMDFHEDVDMLKSVFNSGVKHPIEVMLGSESISDDDTQTFSRLDVNQFQSKSGMFQTGPKDSSIPIPASNGTVEALTDISNIPPPKSVVTNKRSVLPITRTWVKKIKKPVQHAQKRLTDFFLIKRA